MFFASIETNGYEVSLPHLSAGCVVTSSGYILSKFRHRFKIYLSNKEREISRKNRVLNCQSSKAIGF